MNNPFSPNDPFRKRPTRVPVVTLFLLSIVSGANAILSGISVYHGQAGYSLIFFIVFSAIFVTAVTFFVIGVRRWW